MAFINRRFAPSGKDPSGNLPDEFSGKRGHRLNALVRAFVRFDGNIARAIESIREEADEKLLAEMDADKWFSRDFSNIPAAMLIEEGVFNNLLRRALSSKASSGQVAPKVLMALNSERYNPAVQTQEKANEGLTKAFKQLSQRPMTQQQIVNILVTEQTMIPIKDMAQLQIPSLDEAIEMAQKDGTFVVNSHIKEDKDLL